MTFFQILDRVIAGVEKAVVAGGMIVISASVITNVFCREVGIIIIGAEEIDEFSIIWVTFFGTALCARQGIHIIMSALIDRIPEKQRKPLITTICAVTGVFSLILAFLGVQLVLAVLSRGQVSPALRIPVGYFYIAAPMGFLLTGIHYIRTFVRNIREDGIYLGVE